MACPFNKKAEVGDKIGLDFDPEAIHVMRLNETEEEFDRRFESYGEEHMQNKNSKTFYLIPYLRMDCFFCYCTD